ncbi:MAG: peptidyl-prolyl cis-trans isomerase [Deltaproteobacteria bacterium]|nr:peptidyl-prolyl cis-trans isomerase [Deltaproteobacteria bacterium]MBN2674623.1 peptidyl-prolyl cis-trans isomerase [Deltaproteobacteria bacterium]
MKKKNITAIAVVAGAACISIGTLAAKTESTASGNYETVLVESKQFQITVDEFQTIARTQSPAVQKELIASKEEREALLDKMINVNVLAMEAVRRGYDSNPEVVTVKKNRLATLMHSQISGEFDAYAPTEADLKAYYEENIDKYNKPEKVRARHILITDRKKAQALLERLKRDEASQYEFRKIAKTESEDLETRAKGGDLAFFTREGAEKTIDPKVVDAAFQIKTNGALYPKLVETERGFHLVMRTGYRKAMNLSFDEAKGRLVKLVQRQLHRQKTEQAIAALQEKYHVQLFEENLKHVVIDLTKASNGPAAALPQGRRMRR